jgi:CheY-like chemotaxis protein
MDRNFKPTILVIDDDALIRSSFKPILEREGFEVVMAENGTRAIEAMKRTRFDVIIVDIFMPDMDGFETIRKLRAINPTMPVIAISGFIFRDSMSNAPDFLTMATEFGAACSLRKPFKPRQLVEAIRDCLEAEPAPRRPLRSAAGG